MLPRPIGRGCPPTVTEDRPIPGIWRYVTGALPRDDAIGTADLLQAQRLAALLRPALAATLLENYPGLLQGTQFDPENIRRAALKNRFKRGKALPWVRQILALGFDVVFLKGFDYFLMCNDCSDVSNQSKEQETARRVFINDKIDKTEIELFGIIKAQRLRFV